MEAKILVVDDNKASCKLIHKYFSKFGCEIDMAYDAHSAIEVLKSAEYDVVITDKNMPALGQSSEGGMEVLSHVVANSPATQVIMVTGYATVESAIEAMRLGAFDYITKPFELEVLKEKVERIMWYRRFINNSDTIQGYKALQNQIIQMLKKRETLTKDEFHNLLMSFNVKVDHFFDKQKELERMLLVQKEALATIASHAEWLLESIDPEDPAFKIIENIRQASHKSI